MSIRLIIGFSVLAMFSCTKEEPEFFSGPGKYPVYIASDQLDNIANLASKTVENVGPIFLLDDLFFMTDLGKGIQVFDIQDSTMVMPLTFIQIPAVTDFTTDGNLLYADSWMDLVTLDISDLYQVKLVNRVEGVIDPLLFPPLYNGPFECVNISRGAVVAWRDTVFSTVNCHTIN